MRRVRELAALSLVADEGDGDVPSHLRVADEGELLGGPHVDDLHLVRRGLPHFVGLRGSHIETEGRLLHLGKLAAIDREPLAFVSLASVAMRSNPPMRSGPVPSPRYGM